MNYHVLPYDLVDIACGIAQGSAMSNCRNSLKQADHAFAAGAGATAEEHLKDAVRHAEVAEMPLLAQRIEGYLASAEIFNSEELMGCAPPGWSDFFLESTTTIERGGRG